MTIINIASKKSIYIIPGSKSYTLMPEIYTPVDMDMLDSAGLYSVQRDLDVLIVSDNNTALRQYLSKKTLQGAVSAESIQDLMAATLTNSVYDDEANTILVGGSTGGCINYMGEISLAPEINYYNVQNFTDIGCSTVANGDGSITTTPDDPLIAIPNLNNGIGTGFIVLAKDIVIPSVTQNEMSFIWPDLSLDVTGGTSFYVMIYNSSVSDEDLIAGFQMSPSAEIFATILAVELYDGTPSSVYSFNKVGKGDPINYKTFTIPTAGDKIYLNLYIDGNIAFNGQFLPPFPLRYLPEGDNLSIAFMYSTGKASTDLASFEFDFTPRVGNSGFMQIAETIPVTIPSEAVDGDVYKCTASGPVGNTFIHEGDSFILIDNKTDCIPIYCENTIKSIASKIAEASAESAKSSIGLGPYDPYNSVSNGIYVECQPGGQIYNAIQAAINP